MAPKPPRIPPFWCIHQRTVLPPGVTPYPVILKVQAPDESEPVERLFRDRQCLTKWMCTYKRAALEVYATPTQKEEILSESQYFSLDTNRIYGISSPLHTET